MTLMTLPWRTISAAALPKARTPLVLRYSHGLGFNFGLERFLKGLHVPDSKRAGKSLLASGFGPERRKSPELPRRAPIMMIMMPSVLLSPPSGPQPSPSV